MEIYRCHEPFLVSLQFKTAAEHFYLQGVTLLGAYIVGVEYTKIQTKLFPTILP